MTYVALTLMAEPGEYRLALFDHQVGMCVAVTKGPPRRMEVGDRWVVLDGEEVTLVAIVPGQATIGAPRNPFPGDDRYEWTLLPAAATQLRVPQHRPRQLGT